MQYEEYKSRMEAQGRKPVSFEDYAAKVEAGYMATRGVVDKGAYCALPDFAMEELSLLACARDAAAENGKAIFHDLETAKTLLDATAGELGELKGKYAKLEKELRRYRKIADMLAAEVPAEKLRDLLFSAVSAD